MKKTIDCTLCGSCLVDILVRPVPLEKPIGAGVLIHTDPIRVTTGGIVSNCGAAMAKLGMKTAAFSYVGRDDWASVIRRIHEAAGIDSERLLEHPTGATSTSAVLIDASGERSFAHCVGAPKLLDRAAFMKNFDLFEKSRLAVVGYYSLMPNLEGDLREVFAAMRKAGCKTALDAAGDGGGMEPLDRILPETDFYVPSYDEAVHQTGEADPERIIRIFRNCGGKGLLGLKLGSKGALLSPSTDKFVPIAAVKPPGPVVDTTGAGDCFYAGLLTGFLRGMSVEDTGKLAAATGACCVTGMGASAGLRDYEETMKLAGLKG